MYNDDNNTNMTLYVLYILCHIIYKCIMYVCFLFALLFHTHTGQMQSAVHRRIYAIGSRRH